MATPTFLTSPTGARAGAPGLRSTIAARPLGALGPPLLLFVLLRLVVAVLTPAGFADLDGETWARFDSGNYTSIATEGYYFEPCAERGTPEFGELCSNAAWYPGYPYLSAGVSAVVGDFTTAAVVVSQLAFLGVLVLVWAGFLGARPTRRNLLLLVLAGLFPGGIYLLGMFPLSLLVLLVLGQVHLFERRQFTAGAALAALAGVVYPISIVLVPVSAAWTWLATPERPARARLRAAALVGSVAAVGNLAVFALHQVWLGRWDASLVHQRESFDAELRNPAVNLWNVVVDRDSWMQVNAEGVRGLLAAQTLLVLVIVTTCALVVAASVRSRSRRDALVSVGARGTHEHGLVSRFSQLPPDVADQVGLGLFVVALWLLPLTNTIDTGLYRREVAVLPAVLLLRRAPTWVVATLVVVAVPVWALLTQKFYWHVVI